ncbi:MAG: Gfo/Idh/MocA family oxidoreductase [Planctomycetota bacterium]|nr:Gfo/Idh/MocA family oxidoreductase [Planctomycetota bacterium]
MSTTKQKSPLRLGVVGCGWAGRQAVLAAVAGPRTEVTAVSDVSEPLLRAVADEFAVPGRHARYEDLLADDAVDAVYLAVNPVMRHPMVLDALKAGKHVLVQKPHATRAEHILEFEAAAEKAGKTLQFCYFMRHFPNHRRIRAAIQQGRIGQPYHARVFVKFNDRPSPEGITRWQQVYGLKGGSLGQHASHDLNLAWWWMGCPEPEWAFGVKHSVYPRYDGPEGPAEDYYSGLIGFERGMTIQVDCSRWVHADTPNALEVYGSEGAVAHGQITRFDKTFAPVDADVKVDIPFSPAPDQAPCFFHEIDYFAMAVAGIVEPDVGSKDAHQFMRILDALYESAKTGEKVSLRR